MKSKRTILCSVLVVCLFGSLLTVAVNLIKKGKGTSISRGDLDRIKIKKQWVSAAEKIAHETKDKEALAVVSAVLQNLVAAAPTSGGVRVLESSREDIPFTVFLPLVSQDTSNKTFKDIVLNRGIFATYQHQNRTIIVKEVEPSSEVWKGLMLLHEGHHAGDLLYEPYDLDDPELFSDHERHVHNFQNRLTSAIGGFTYDRLLRKEVARIRTELKKQGLDGVKRQAGASTNLTIPNRTEYYAELDDALTPALSQFEKDARQTSFWIHAVFMIYEEDRPLHDAEVGKSIFLRMVYQRGGVLK